MYGVFSQLYQKFENEGEIKVLTLGPLLYSSDPFYTRREWTEKRIFSVGNPLLTYVTHKKNYFLIKHGFTGKVNKDTIQ